MNRKTTVLVKVYSWRDLTRLAVRDMCERYNMPCEAETSFHYLGGTDRHGAPFLRIDLTPMKKRQRKK